MHVLSAGEEDTATARVMRECAKLGPGVVIHTDRAALGGERLQGGRRGGDLVTAGELHLAQDGVLLVNNITSCKQASKVRKSWHLKASALFVNCFRRLLSECPSHVRSPAPLLLRR